MPQVRALVIDDNLQNISVLEQLLRVEGVACHKISNMDGLGAKLNDIKDINVVFLDLELPKMTGFEAIKIIKAHPNFRRVPVIAYTVHVSEWKAALNLGFDGFLGKPLSAEKFPDQLAHILSGERVIYMP